MKLQNPSKFFKYLFLSWGSLIMIVSSIPYLTVPVPDRLAPDKAAHFLEYMIFSCFFCLFLFYSRKSEKRIFTLTILLVAFALLDEFHQMFIPGRAFSWYDFGADFLGIISGWSILYIMNRKRETS